MGWLLYLFVVAAGSFSAVQAGANAQLRKSLDQPLLAALCVYGSALIALLISATRRIVPSTWRTRSVPSESTSTVSRPYLKLGLSRLSTSSQSAYPAAS